MIEIIIVIAVFAVISYVLTTIFSYFWLGLICIFIIISAIVIGALILQAGCVCAAAALGVEKTQTVRTKQRQQHPHRDYELERRRDQVSAQPQTIIQIAVAPGQVEAKEVHFVPGKG